MSHWRTGDRIPPGALVRPMFRVLAGIVAFVSSVAVVGVITVLLVDKFHPVLVWGLLLSSLGLHVSVAVVWTGYPPRYLRWLDTDRSRDGVD
jgi:hypothetical protein